MPKLVIFRGDSVESEIRLTGNTVRVGRHERNDVVLDDGLNGVSRFHAEIRPEGSTYCIVDLNSRNGVWVNGRRIKERAPLSLGVPVTVGAFELTLEDDISTTDFQPAAGQPTVVSPAAASAIRQTGSSGSGTRPRQPAAPSAAARNPVLLWSAAGAAFVLACVITYAIFRNSSTSKPVDSVAAETTTTTAVAEPPPPLTRTPEQEAQEHNALDLLQARELVAAGDSAAALRDHLQPLLERDPDNAEGLELKRQIEQTMAATTRRKTTPAPAAPVEPEIEGVTRRPNEPYADYQTRARRLSSGITEGKNSLDKQDYAAAVARFRAIDREQPRYMGVDGLLADAIDRQQKALEEAISSGQQNEQANRWKTARQWYQRAQIIDPTSTAAKEKYASVFGRINAEATTLYNKATFAVKSQDTQVAMRQYQQILDLMMPGDELWEKAKKESEALKR